MSLNSTFNAPFGSAGGKGTPGVYDRDASSKTGKPRDVGKDAQPEKFYENTPGFMNGTQVASPMGSAIPMSTKPVRGGGGVGGPPLESTFKPTFGK